MLNEKYTLYLIEPKTGKKLNSDARFWKSSDSLGYKDTFNKFEDAEIEKNTLLEKVVWAAVMIYEKCKKRELLFKQRNRTSVFS